MKPISTKPLSAFIEEQTERLGQNSTTIYSVTNEKGFIRSLDLFDKQVFSANTGNYKKVAYGDLAYNPSRINVGSVALCEDQNGGAVSPMYCIVRCKDGLLPKYLLHYLKSEDGLLQIRHRCEGAVRFQLKFRDLREIPLGIPSISEQKRIVKLLDEADAIRKLRAQAAQNSTTLISALFSKMFGDPASNSNRWTIAPLMNVGRVVTGNTPSRKKPSYFGNFIEWVKTDNINSNRGIVTNTAEGLSKEGASVGRIVPAGAVLITCIAGTRERIGDAAVTTRSVAINQQINAVIPNANFDSAFLCQQIGALKPVIHSRTNGNMTGIINKSSLESIPVICPPASLQKEFAARVEEIRKLESAQSASRNRLDGLFQALLHRAFQGEL